MQGFEAIIALANIITGQPVLTNQQVPATSVSPPFYPSPWMDGNTTGWEEAYVKAKDFVSQLTLLEKVNLTTGVGWEGEQVCSICLTYL